ncbi:MAG: hypothetical protein EHM33_13415 [Chloroflexi bacterium]|nr:MAG: hypothetical protein EHM33_13415 [Chloroflexota bacterium]
MATSQKTKLLIWVTALALVMACAPSLTTQSAPTIDPGAINTLIAQTANVALTRTAAALPSATLTPTIVPTRNTETPTPTATSTVIFIFSSPTPLVIPTITFASSGSSSDNYACQVTRVSPPNGSSFNPRDDFDVFWTVKNIGKKRWDRSDVDYMYSSGAKIHKISGYDLDDNVRVGNTIDLGVDMSAPKDPGSYTTTWTMHVGEKNFCTLNFTIVVRPEE